MILCFAYLYLLSHSVGCYVLANVSSQIIQFKYILIPTGTHIYFTFTHKLVIKVFCNPLFQITVSFHSSNYVYKEIYPTWKPFSKVNIFQISQSIAHPAHFLSHLVWFEDQPIFQFMTKVGENLCMPRKYLLALFWTVLTVLAYQASIPLNSNLTLERHLCENDLCTPRKDFVILQLYWCLFSSTKHCSWNMV